MYKWKNKHNAAAAAQNINAAFGNGSVNEHTIQCWYATLEIRGKNLTNKDWGKIRDCCVDNEVLWAITEKNPGNTVIDYAEELGISPTTISRHLKLFGEVKKNG